MICTRALRAIASKSCRLLNPKTHTLSRRDIMAPARGADKIEDRLVWVDCEMTGLDLQKDTLLEIAVLVTTGELDIVAEGPNRIIHQPDEVLEAMGDWCQAHHGQSGLTQAVRDSKVSMKECENEIVAFLQQHTKKGCSPLAGNSVGQDAKFLEKCMPTLMNHLHYRIVDVSTIKELSRRWFPEVVRHKPVKKMTHRALDDIKESLEELKFYKSNVFIQL